ncbi:MAG: mandelate racemase/muconate lactonizing enzyme family protein [Burkholderiales bacterium]
MAAIAALEPVVVHVSPKTNWTFIAVTLADGAVGWGECSLNGWEPLLVAQAGMLARDAIGRDPDDAVELVRYLPHSPGGLVAHAVKSAVEQALTDLRARAAGRPVARWLSDAPRATVPAYANVNRSVVDRSPAGFADAARRAVAAGYRAVKLAPFDGVIAMDAASTPIDARTHAGLDRVFAVREAVGAEVAVMVDCHWRFDVDRAETLLADIAPAKPYWVECMISEHPLGYGSIARLTALAHERGIRTAGGEAIAGADQALAMCTGRLYDVLMPDIKYAGGYAGMQAIAGVCAAHGVDFAPHNPTGPIAHCASLQACAVAPTLLWLEHQWSETPLFEALVGGPVAPLVDGAFVVPAAPGLGAALDRAVAAAHPYAELAAGANLDPRLG